MNFVVSQILQKMVNQRSINQLTKKLRPGKGSTTELMDVNCFHGVARTPVSPGKRALYRALDTEFCRHAIFVTGTG
jgi:hypothetical protein